MDNLFSRLRFPLMLGGLLVLLTGITLISTYLTRTGNTSKAETLDNRSVYNAAPSGYKALHTILQHAGIRTSIWRQPFEELPETRPSVMLVVEPYAVSGQTVLFSKPQIQTLLGWVHHGNTLILLDDFQRYHELGSRVFLDSLNIVAIRTPGKPDEQKPQTLHLPDNTDPLLKTFLSHRLASPVPATFQTATSPYAIQPLLTNQAGQTVLFSVNFGAGKLILGSVPELASNRLLHEKKLDNYQFLANLITRQPGPVYINEYVHGYTEITDLLSYYRQKTPLEPLVLQLTLGFLAVLWISMLPDRLCRPDPDAAPTPDTTGFLTAMAHIYQRSHAGSLALEPQLAQLESWLRRYYRLDLSQRDRLRDLLKARSEAYSGGEAPEAEDWLKTVDRARDVVAHRRKVSPKELLHLSRQLTTIHDRLFEGQTHGRSNRTTHPGNRR